MTKTHRTMRQEEHTRKYAWREATRNFLYPSIDISYIQKELGPDSVIVQDLLLIQEGIRQIWQEPKFSSVRHVQNLMSQDVALVLPKLYQENKQKEAVVKVVAGYFQELSTVLDTLKEKMRPFTEEK